MELGSKGAAASAGNLTVQPRVFCCHRLSLLQLAAVGTSECTVDILGRRGFGAGLGFINLPAIELL